MTYLKSQDKSPGTMDRALASIAVAHGAADLPKPSTVGARRVLKGHEAERKKSKDRAAGPRHPWRTRHTGRRRHRQRPRCQDQP